MIGLRMGFLRITVLAVTLALVLAAFLVPMVEAQGPQPVRPPDTRPPRPGAGAIYGLVYQDWNQNGRHDPGEPGLGAASLLLRDVRGKIVGRYVTGRDGAYELEGLASGRYILSEVDPEGYSSLQRHKLAVVVKNATTVAVDFGDVLLLGGRPRIK